MKCIAQTLEGFFVCNVKKQENAWLQLPVDTFLRALAGEQPLFFL